MHASARRVGLSIFLVALLQAAAVAAADGDGTGFGPVLAFTWPSGTSLGWELSGTRGGSVLAHFTLGGSYQISPHARDPAYFHYLAWEPWVYAGGTLGAALTDQFEPRVLYGLWEGLPVSLDGDLFFDRTLQWVFTITLGWRGVGRMHQFYITPKLWRVRGFDFFS